jgi:hypothetical protein
MHAESLVAVWQNRTREDATKRLEKLKIRLHEQNLSSWADIKIEPVKSPVVRHIKNINKRNPAYLYIGRGSKWGNPYVMQTREDREKVIDKYEQMILSNQELLGKLHELNGKTLGCYCYPLKCHGDILVKLFQEKFVL